MKILEVKNLTVLNRHTNEVLLNNISFKLNQGEILGIVGESGSGKTLTGLSVLGLLDKSVFNIKHGSIIYNNIDILKLSDTELQKIINSKPKNWTKKDFRGEGKLNSEKLLTRKETDRPGLIFYQKGKRINMKNILNHSTEESIQEFKKGEIDFSTLKNRSSTIKWRSNMSDKERELYDKKVYANLTEKQLEAKRERQRDYFEKYLKKND